MGRRAESVDETRQRIVEAALRLHGSIGPAHTSIAAIAAEADVTRLTVYRHFPDETQLYQACTAHWLTQRVPPDPDAWRRIEDPAARLAAGLADLYRFYRDGQGMLTLVHRDWEHMPEPQRQAQAGVETHQVKVLLEPFPARGARRRRLQAVIGHATGFPTWRSLCVVHGLSDPEAVDTMTTLAQLTAEDAGRRRD